MSRTCWVSMSVEEKIWTKIKLPAGTNLSNLSRDFPPGRTSEGAFKRGVTNHAKCQQLFSELKSGETFRMLSPLG